MIDRTCEDGQRCTCTLPTLYCYVMFVIHQRQLDRRSLAILEIANRRFHFPKLNHLRNTFESI